MTLEERIAEALAEEAERRPVNLQRLYAGTRERPATSRPPWRGWRWAAPVAVAATVLGVVGVVTSQQVGRIGFDRLPFAGGTALEGGVSETFDCPNTGVYDWTRPESMEDDYYAASLRGGPQKQADSWGVPRYSYEETGDTAYLRFGNRDGTLATVNEFHRVDGTWTPIRTEYCVGPEGSIAVATDEELTLTAHAGTPYPADALGGRAPLAELVDDRELYTGIGLRRHRSVWAEPCRRQLCVTAISDPTSGVSSMTRPDDDGRPREMSLLFWPPDEMVGHNARYRFFVLWDRDGEVSQLRGELTDGATQVSQPLTGQDWEGTAHLLLVPADRLDQVVVVPREGPSRSYDPDELPS